MGFLSRLFERKKAKGSHLTDDGHQMVSLVLLTKGYINLDTESLRIALDKIFPGKYLPPRDIGNLVVDGPVKGATFMITSDIPGCEGCFMLHSVQASYENFSPFISGINDKALLKAVKDHGCWLSVDRIANQGTPEGHYRLIGRLIAQLAPPDAIALVHPSQMWTIPITPELLNQLALDVSQFLRAVPTR